MEFNFNVNANKTNSNESNKLADVKATEAQPNKQNLIVNASDESENIKETTAEAKTEAKAKADDRRVVLTYVSGGVWKDTNGKYWSRNERPDVDILASRAYSMEEYQSRKDLVFMVEYGELKLILA